MSQERPIAADKEIDQRTTAIEDIKSASDNPTTLSSPPERERGAMTHAKSLSGPSPPTAPVKLFPIPPGTAFKRHTVGSEGNAAGAGERLVYSNTLGTFGAPLGAGNLFADDLTMSVIEPCTLRRFEFPVVGKIDPNGIGGDYTVSWALYTNCPGSVPSTSRAGLIITGTQGQVTFRGSEADAPALISFIAGPNVSLRTNVWFGVKFSRDNAGVVVGTPPLEGFSCDQFDFPGSPCSNNFGGFPNDPQGSMNLEIYADSACAAAYTGYKDNKPSGSPYNPGANVLFADDIELVDANCNLVGYEVAIRGSASYKFDLRNNCEGPAIPGTERSFIINQGTDVKIARFTFDPPIPLPQNLWFSTQINNGTGGVVVAGQDACIGHSENFFGVLGQNGCNPVVMPSPIHSAFSLAITCAGPAPTGACCDMLITQCQGGPNAGLPCSGRCTHNNDIRCEQVTDCPTGESCAVNGDCNHCSGGTLDGSPCDPLIPAAQNPCNLGGGTCPNQGTCESVCREVSQTNCPFPTRGSSDQPAWVPGGVCVPDPFGANYSCGKAACCQPDYDCANRTLNECNAVPPVDRPRQWQRGRYCSSQGQYCPLNACLGRSGDCTVPHPTPGCNDPTCCEKVCRIQPFGPYCCIVEWDQTCTDLACLYCTLRLSNDVCAPTRDLEGARLLSLVNGFDTAESGSSCATAEASGPGFGCYLDNPGKQGLQTAWYKFVATQDSAVLQTCNSNAPATDSLLEVFAVGDPSTPVTQCRTLIPIGCSDDVQGCSASNKNSKMCLSGLLPGNLYYVLVASKVALSPGHGYRLDISTSPSECVKPPPSAPGDYCPGALPIVQLPGHPNDSTTAFDMAGPPPLPPMTLDAPIETCIPSMTADMWYKYTATCSGTLTVDTCGADPHSTPDTNLAIYDQGLCPPVSGAPIACSADAGGNCGLGSRLQLDVVQGNLYTIRLADSGANLPAGNLNINCAPAACPSGTLTFTSPPDGVVDARRPRDPNDPSQAEGIQTITASLTPGAKPECFSLCETAVGETPNAIGSVEENPAGRYTIRLARPITPGAKTTVAYTDLHGSRTVLRLVSHPGNVDGDGLSSPADIGKLVGALQGTFTLPFGVYSGDIDHSFAITPADVLEEVDLLNGNGGVWDGTPNPIGEAGCP